METLKTYLESLFATVPKTPEMEQMKEDLLANMLDRYQELKDDGKSEAEAIGQAISEFGSIDELLEEVDLRQTKAGVEAISIFEMEAYEEKFRKNILGIALGVLLTCFGVGNLIIAVGWRAAASGVYMMGNMMSMAGAGINATGIGIGIFVITVAVAVGLFIACGLGLTRLNAAYNDRLIDESVKRVAAEHRSIYQATFTILLLLGIGLCILSLLPMLLAVFNQFYLPIIGWVSQIQAAGLLIIIAGIGVFFLIYGGACFGMYTKFVDHAVFIADEDNLGPNARQVLGRSQSIDIFIDKIYWPVILIIYFAWSFIFGAWAVSWLIFPIAGWIKKIIRSAERMKNKNKA